MIGTRILNYEIKSLIGEGGMGAVYMAEHLQVNRKVAIKVLHPKFLKNEEIKQRFKNEAATLSHLHHPNIVGLFDYLEDESGLYLIMEYVDGVQLDDYIINTTGPMPEEKAIPLMKQILSAFAYAHGKGVVHRDIKPANIIITTTNDVKILDFGIARILGEANNMTKTGTQMGTVFYMSPEQVQGKRADIRSDIYSLGVTFYQMLTGVNPYQNLTTEYEVYTKIVKEDLPPANQIYPGVSAYLVSILKFALEKDPDLRFQNCTEILKALEDKNTIFEGFNTKKETLKIEKITFGDISDSNKVIQKESSKPKNKKLKSFFIFLGITLVGVILFYILSLYYFENKDLDNDGDGVPNRIDLCIDEFGDVKNDGCPLDSDGDGIIDSKDKCINESGPSENNGCPYQDSDGDGVSDLVDNCLSTPGKGENGCPIEGQIVFWFDSDRTGKWEGNVSIYFDNDYYGEINDWFTSNPGCGAEGCVTITKFPGKYRWYAISENGVEWEGGIVEIFEDDCIDKSLFIN